MNKKNNSQSLSKHFKKVNACLAEDFCFWIPDFTDCDMPVESEINPDSQLNEYLVWLATHLSNTEYCLSSMHTEILRIPSSEKWTASRLACFIGGAAFSGFYELWGNYVLESNPKTIEADAIFPLDTNGSYVDETYLDFMFIQQSTLVEKKCADTNTPLYYDFGWRPLLQSSISRTENPIHKVLALHSFYSEFQDLYSKN